MFLPRVYTKPMFMRVICISIRIQKRLCACHIPTFSRLADSLLKKLPSLDFHRISISMAKRLHICSGKVSLPVIQSLFSWRGPSWSRVLRDPQLSHPSQGGIKCGVFFPSNVSERLSWLPVFLRKTIFLRYAKKKHRVNWWFNITDLCDVDIL